MNIINLDTCLQQKSAFWYAKSKVEVFLTNHKDSLFSETITDSLGYFKAKIPSNKSCYIKIEGSSGQWGEKQLPLFIRNIKQDYSLEIPFIPFLRIYSSLGEYVIVKQKRRFPFLKKRMKLEHHPPTMYDYYKPGNYTFRYKTFQYILTKNQNEFEINFPELAHNVVSSNVQNIKMRYSSLGVLLQEEETFEELVEGGMRFFQSFINRNRKLPQEILKETANHTVKIACIYYVNGTVSYPIIVNSDDSWHDKEALRLIGILPRFTLKLGRARGPFSRHIVNIDINFNYPK
ncbi:hypothetical protein FVB32_12420 [Flagellimonas hymeniacidonis]|uniref:TonB C-terminal domain-containing protein n=1 Tax=Flagellimonas hymeniacidonis TaxID=2603628 RepID=A0A5C8V0T0_9FLAO|nr:hypothetical protein [Flagellimonas hymeniacidonis]TXN35383.1 hypothetical protein FVB32_12420 [Flagellimonas hymeniacidonis]